MPAYIILVGASRKPFEGSLADAKKEAKYWAAAYEKGAGVYSASTGKRVVWVTRALTEENAGFLSKRKTKKRLKKRYPGYTPAMPASRGKKSKRRKRDRRRNPAAPPRGKALAFHTKAAAEQYARANGLKGIRIFKAKR